MQKKSQNPSESASGNSSSQSWILRGVLLLIFIAYSISFARKIGDVVTEKKTCVCSYDGLGYYLYLPQLFGHGNLDMDTETTQKLQNTYCDSLPVYQLYHLENGRTVDIYQMGLAMVELPAYCAGDLCAKMGGYPQDGFSKPYHMAFIVNAWLFVVLGLIFLTRLLRLFAGKTVTAILLLIAFFGTNYWVIATEGFIIQHHYLFAIIAAFAYFLLSAHQQKKYKGRAFYIAVLLFGLCTVIRPTHVLLGLFPFLLLWKQLPSRAIFWRKMSLFAVSALVWNIPQILYWKLVGGSWIILNLHVEELILVDPHVVDFLSSFRKGWLVYTPVFLLLIPGFVVVFRGNRRLFWALLVTALVMTWIFASWECWWYAASFGSRVMIDLYPLLLIPLAFLLQEITKKRLQKYLIGSFIAATLVLSVFQSWQYENGLIDPERMTADQYRYVFGRSNTTHFDDHRLLINRSDTTWVEKVGSGKFPDQHIQKTLLFELHNPVTAIPGIDLPIVKIPFFGHLETDETLVEAELEYTTSDTTKSSVLRLESASRFNCYNWQSVELSLGKPAGKRIKQHFRFNLPDIHHQKDKLQVYVDNDQPVSITIYQLKVTGYSLVRD